MFDETWGSWSRLLPPRRVRVLGQEGCPRSLAYASHCHRTLGAVGFSVARYVPKPTGHKQGDWVPYATRYEAIRNPVGKIDLASGAPLRKKRRPLQSLVLVALTMPVDANLHQYSRDDLKLIWG
jgi:hypothetical protein